MIVTIIWYENESYIDCYFSYVSDNGWGMQGGAPNGMGGGNSGMGGLGGNQGNQGGNKTSTQVTIPKDVSY